MCQVVAAMGRQSYGEVFASELGTKDAYVVRKPRGVVAVISPWNFPLAIGSFWASAPALVEGNTVVHKPSDLTPMVNQMVAELFHEAGFPAGVYNLIHGNGIVGAVLVRSGVDVILFTGSAVVGQDIRRHCAEVHGKTCSMELGSKSATIVFEDGSFDLALEVSLASAFKLSGQRCVSSGRILVERKIYDKFCEEFVNQIKNKVTCKDPFAEPHWDGHLSYGPMISKTHMERVETYNQLARSSSGVRVLYDPDGECKIESQRGYFLRPFVYGCEWGATSVLKTEVFGPHVGIVPFNDLDDAIRIYNDTEYGLALGVVTDDFRKHRRLAQDCTAGMLYVNGSSIGAESHLPFSSWKKSGNGSSASGTWKAVTHTMAVTVNYEEGKFQFAQGMK
jgi:aldehyde dehydrogenase (NAD+)